MVDRPQDFAGGSTAVDGLSAAELKKMKKQQKRKHEKEQEQKKVVGKVGKGKSVQSLFFSFTAAASMKHSPWQSVSVSSLQLGWLHRRLIKLCATSGWPFFVYRVSAADFTFAGTVLPTMSKLRELFQWL